MGIRDKEIERIRLYCRGLNIKVNIRDYVWEHSAEWSNEPTHVISVNKRKNTTKTDLILTLLHEISHAIYNKHTGIPVPAAVLLEGKNGNPIPKKDRQKIFNFENESLAYMISVYKELELTIPQWKVNMAREFDVWCYEVYVDTGYFPGFKECKEKRKELTLKYKPEGKQ